MQKCKCILLSLLIISLASKSMHAQAHDSTNVRNGKKDSTKKEITVYVSLNPAVSLPLFDYGSRTFNLDPETPLYSGFASPGYGASIVGGVLFNTGFEFTVMASIDRHAIDVASFVHENQDFFGGPFIGNNYWVPATNVSADGAYSYTDYILLLGFTKNWGPPNCTFGLSFMAGQIIVTLPSMSGTIGAPGGNSSTNTFAWGISAFSKGNFCADLGIHLSIQIKKHLFLTPRIDFLLSSIIFNDNCQLTDLTAGSTYYGSISNSNYLQTGEAIGILNGSLGITYQF